MKGEGHVMGVQQYAIASHTAYRPLSEIAGEIRRSWKSAPPSAAHYVDVMSQMDAPDDDYEGDPGAAIVFCFLAKAAAWQGETARRIKAELEALTRTW
jgi:hypothetical protein